MSKYCLRIQPLRSMLSNSHGPEVHLRGDYRRARNWTTGIWDPAGREDTKTYAGSNPQLRILRVSEPFVSVARADSAPGKAHPAQFTTRQGPAEIVFRTTATHCRRRPRDPGCRARRPLQDREPFRLLTPRSRDLRESRLPVQVSALFGSLRGSRRVPPNHA